MGNDIGARCAAIEECYEFMLAYAGQGLAGDAENQSSGQVRDYLNRAVNALSGLAGCYADAVKQENLQPAERYHAFLEVLDRDASDSIAVIQLVLAQATLSSQLIDNMNASIHLRALLTDLFLVDEILKSAPHECKIRDDGLGGKRKRAEKLPPTSFSGTSTPLGGVASEIGKFLDRRGTNSHGIHHFHGKR